MRLRSFEEQSLYNQELILSNQNIIIDYLADLVKEQKRIHWRIHKVMNSQDQVAALAARENAALSTIGTQLSDIHSAVDGTQTKILQEIQAIKDANPAVDFSSLEAATTALEGITGQVGNVAQSINSIDANPAPIVPPAPSGTDTAPAQEMPPSTDPPAGSTDTAPPDTSGAPATDAAPLATEGADGGPSSQA